MSEYDYDGDYQVGNPSSWVEAGDGSNPIADERSVLRSYMDPSPAADPTPQLGYGHDSEPVDASQWDVNEQDYYQQPSQLENYLVENVAQQAGMTPEQARAGLENAMGTQGYIGGQLRDFGQRWDESQQWIADSQAAREARSQERLQQQQQADLEANADVGRAVVAETFYGVGAHPEAVTPQSTESILEAAGDILAEQGQIARDYGYSEADILGGAVELAAARELYKDILRKA